MNLHRIFSNEMLIRFIELHNIAQDTFKKIRPQGYRHTVHNVRNFNPLYTSSNKKKFDMDDCDLMNHTISKH